MLDILQTGKYGVLTNQKLLGTTSNNITNVNTDGYTRQETHVYTNAVDWGVGATVTRRMYDRYIQRELFRDQGNVGFYDSYSSGLSTVDTLLSKEDSSISTSLNSLFSSMQQAVQNTPSVASRRELLTQFQNIVDRYNTLNYNMRNELTSVNNRVDDTAKTINDLVKGIYEVNKQVRKLGQDTQSDIGMQLLDKRDQLVNELSNYVDLSVTTESDGSLSLYMGNGQLLVNGDTYGTINVTTDKFDSTLKSLSLVFEVPAKTEVTIPHDGWGGKLGGLLVSGDDIRQAMRELGQSALAFADAMNEQNKGGITLDNKAGQDLINIPDVKAVSSNKNYGMTVSFPDGEGSNIRSSDYKVVFRDGKTQVYYVQNGKETLIPEDKYTKSQDAKGNLVISLNDADTDPNSPVNGFKHGVTFTFSASETDLQNNKVEFLAQPTLNAAFDIKLNITKPEEFAFASAIRANTIKHEGNAYPEIVGVTNTGAGQGVQFDGTTNLPTFSKAAPNYVKYNSQTQSYDIYHVDPADINEDGTVKENATMTKIGSTKETDGKGKNLFANATWDANAIKGLDATAVGADGNVIDGFPGYDVNFVGTVVEGSSFTLSINKDGYNDNSNGNLLAGLQQGNLVYSTDSVKGTFTEDYADLTAMIGSSVMSANTDLKAATAKYEQSYNQFYSVAGVNLDEEAANLIRYQQSYSACAKIISASQTIFDALINSI